ncbi:MAG: GtrA family protein [Bryobacteraceae bacterium]
MRHFLRFNAVGALGIGIQLVALTVFQSGLHLHYLIATALAVEAAVVHNFVWHERWTWRGRAGAQGLERRLLRFHLTVGLVSILGNLILMRLLVGQLHLPYLASNLLAIGVCSLVNFVASDRFVFR